MGKSIEQLSIKELAARLEIGRVDAKNQALFCGKIKQTPKKEKLTLVIGVGGFGLSTIREAVLTAREKLTPDYSEFVKFIMIDADLNVLNYKKMPEVDTIRIPYVDPYGKWTEENKSFYREFAPDYLLDYEMFDTSRSMTRFKFYAKINDKSCDVILREKIESIFSNEWAEYNTNPINVMIVTGLCGDTGSGAFLDIAAQVRKACKRHRVVRMFGYFVMPDAFEHFWWNELTKEAFCRNAFAALKELESYMSISFEKDRKELFPALNPSGSYEISGTDCLFDYPYLISEPYDTAVVTIAKLIVDSIADFGGQFDYAAFHANFLPIRECQLSKYAMMVNSILKEDACPEDSHMYCGFGYAKASIPERIVIPNYVGRVIRRMYEPIGSIDVEPALRTQFCSIDNRLTRIEFEQQMRVLLNLDARIKLDANSLLTKVNSLLQDVSRLPQNNIEITRQDIISGNVTDYLRGFGVDRTVNTAIPALVDKLQKLYESFTEQAKLVMNIYGPRAIQYLYEGKGNDDKTGVAEDYSDICLRKQIEVVSTAFNRYANTPPKYPQRIEGSNWPLKELWNNFTQKNVAEWIGQAQNAARNDVYYQVSQRMAGVNGGWKRVFEDSIIHFKDSCARFACILETMMEYYACVGSSLDEDNYQRFSKSAGDPFDVNLCSDDASYQWIRGQIAEKANEINIIGAKKTLVDDFFKNQDAWVDLNHGVTRQQFDEVISRICRLGKYADADSLSISIRDFFDVVLKDTPVIEHMRILDDTINQIVERLCKTSLPSIKIQKGKLGHISRVVIVPCELMVGSYGLAVRNAIRDNLGPNDTFVESPDTDSITCYQFSFANALCDMEGLDWWEDAYDRTVTSTTHLSEGERVRLHMETGYTQYKELTKTETDRKRQVQSKWGISKEDDIIFGTGLSWRNHPSINTLRYGNDFSTGDTLEANYRRNIFNKKIDKALELGIIECEKNGSCYKYWLNTIPNECNDLDCSDYTERDKDGLYRRGQALFDFLGVKNACSGKTYRKPIMLNSDFGKDGFDFTDAILRWHWGEETIHNACVAYIKRIMRKATGLYQDMEDTLYHMYDIEKAMEEEEANLPDYRNRR